MTESVYISKASELASYLKNAKESNGQIACKCPLHEDNTPSLFLKDSEGRVLWHCFGGCSNADLFEYFTKTLKLNFLPRNKIELPKGIPIVYPTSYTLKKNGLEPSPDNQKLFSALYTYRDIDQNILGFVARYESRGKKDIRPFFKKNNDGYWMAGHLYNENRPLYGINKYFTKNKILEDFSFLIDTIIIVEGEKAADAINALESRFLAVTWSSGASSYNKCDWSPLIKIVTDNNLKVILWADHDLPGYKAMAGVNLILSKEKIVSKFIILQQKEKGFDAADYLAENLDLNNIETLVYHESDFNNELEKLKMTDKADKVSNTKIVEKEKSTEAIKAVSEKNDIDFILGYSLTDTGNAERLYKLHGDKVKYTNESGWYIYDGKKWTADSNFEIVRMAEGVGKTILRLLQDPKLTFDKKSVNKIKAFAEKSLSQASVNNMISLLRALPGVTISYENFDSSPWLLCCKNGIVDLRNGELLRHDKKHYISKYVDINYCPEKKSELWLKFLERIMHTDEQPPINEMLDYIKRAVGYSLTGSTREQCVFFMWGNGQNGKSVFMETVKKICGNYSVATDTNIVLLDKHGSELATNGIARLKGVRCVVGSEIPNGAKLNESKVKEITGQDTITARFLYKEYFEFTPQFKIWIRCNALPDIVGTDNGIWRRIKCIPFNAKITEEERDPNLQEKFNGELEGILSWAVDGARLWYNEGINTPTYIENKIIEYRTEMDRLADFIEQNCVVSDSHKVQATLLFNNYLNWAKINNEYAVSQRAFGLKMKIRDFKKIKSNGTVYYIGITTKDDMGLPFIDSNVSDDCEIF